MMLLENMLKQISRILLISSCLLFASQVTAQDKNQLARAEYGLAEDAFLAMAYEKAINHLNATVQLLNGKTNARIDYLKIVCYYKLYKAKGSPSDSVIFSLADKAKVFAYLNKERLEDYQYANIKEANDFFWKERVKLLKEGQENIALLNEYNFKLASVNGAEVSLDNFQGFDNKWFLGQTSTSIISQYKKKIQNEILYRYQEYNGDTLLINMFNGYYLYAPTYGAAIFLDEVLPIDELNNFNGLKLKLYGFFETPSKTIVQLVYKPLDVKGKTIKELINHFTPLENSSLKLVSNTGSEVSYSYLGKKRQLSVDISKDGVLIFLSMVDPSENSELVAVLPEYYINPSLYEAPDLKGIKIRKADSRGLIFEAVDAKALKEIGIREGDILLSIDKGELIQNEQDFFTTINQYRKGETVLLKVIKQGKEVELLAVL